MASPDKKSGLSREMGLLGLVATGICSMIGAAINVIPFMIQRNVPGIGPYVLPAYLFAAVPAILAACQPAGELDRQPLRLDPAGGVWGVVHRTAHALRGALDRSTRLCSFVDQPKAGSWRAIA